MDVYSAKLTFKKNSGIVIVEVRDIKKGRAKRKSLPILEDINREELHWIRYQKEIISVYHRKIRVDNYEYRDPKHVIAPTSLSQRLEKIVSNVYSDFLSEEEEFLSVENKMQ